MDYSDSAAAAHEPVGLPPSADIVWEHHLQRHKDDDDVMLESWREDMDGLLIFVRALFSGCWAGLMRGKAGLYSAALTAFIVESYKLLQRDPADLTAALLVQISRQLPDASLPNGLSAEHVPFAAAPSSVAVNALWFLSLILSLSCALGATLVKQWARQYSHNIRRQRNATDRGRVRALLREGVDRWNMDAVVDGLPALLHLAVTLFLLGLTLFLFPIHRAAFGVVLGAVTIVGTVYMYLTVAPMGEGDCPFRTPLSSTTGALIRWIVWFLRQRRFVKHHQYFRAFQRSRVISVDLARSTACDSLECPLSMTPDAWLRRCHRESDSILSAFYGSFGPSHSVALIPAFVKSIYSLPKRYRGTLVFSCLAPKGFHAWLEEHIQAIPLLANRLPAVWAFVSSMSPTTFSGTRVEQHQQWQFALVDVFARAIEAASIDKEAAMSRHCSIILCNYLACGIGYRDETHLQQLYRLLQSASDDSTANIARAGEVHIIMGSLESHGHSWFYIWDCIHKAEEILSPYAPGSSTSRSPISKRVFLEIAEKIGTALRLSSADCRWMLLDKHFEMLWAIDLTERVEGLDQFVQTARHLIDQGLDRAGGDIWYAPTVATYDPLVHAGISITALAVVQKILRAALSMDCTLFDSLRLHFLFLPDLYDPESDDEVRFAFPCLLARDTCTDDLFTELVHFRHQNPDRAFASAVVDRAVAKWGYRRRLEELEAELARRPPGAAQRTSGAADEDPAATAVRGDAACGSTHPDLAVEPPDAPSVDADADHDDGRRGGHLAINVRDTECSGVSRGGEGSLADEVAWRPGDRAAITGGHGQRLLELGAGLACDRDPAAAEPPAAPAEQFVPPTRGGREDDAAAEPLSTSVGKTPLNEHTENESGKDHIATDIKTDR